MPYEISTNLQPFIPLANAPDFESAFLVASDITHGTDDSVYVWQRDVGMHGYPLPTWTLVGVARKGIPDYFDRSN